MDTPIPQVIAFILCERATKDNETGQWTLVKVLSKIGGYEFPATQPHLSVYVGFSEAKGDYGIKLQLIDIDKKLVIGETNLMKTEINDPSSYNEFVISIEGLTFPHPGTYSFLFLANDRIVAERLFEVEKLEQPQEEVK